MNEVSCQLIRKTITADDKHHILSVPFDVAPTTERLEVILRAPEHAVVDLGIADSRTVRGWSGGARRQVTFSGQHWATPGYLPGIHPGRWAALLGAYRIPASGCPVEVIVRQWTAQPRWLKGDLHLHSLHSDGQEPPELLAQRAIAAGLDFIVLTDHNTVSQNRLLPQAEHLLVVPGMEWTSYAGHANILGLTNAGDFRVTNRDELSALFQSYRDQGAVISINHPFATECEGCNWQWGWHIPFDAIEVWNGPWRESNHSGLTWWHTQLASGHAGQWTALGGSDYHRPDNYVSVGQPTTWVYAPRYDPSSILKSLAQGLVSLSADPQGPVIAPNVSGSAVLARHQPRPSARQVAIHIDAVRPRDEIRILSDRGVEEQWTVGPEGQAGLWEGNLIDRHFVRVEVYRPVCDGLPAQLVALSNPLFFDAD
jgi:hypothetical protein